ncbi:uncharacterized protein, YigZ family [Apibacter mensalis]|uniref:Uncharacterized protein, YigZ family n=1 Tax=Apibacter mensalis TaxID=1586267 RepID=A0A0X3ASY1_9FLAO|nr:YigZ family protein [Apibacter mensalis]CVK16968.1 uncharacterized protein, YigZ family [Apibacter mensalis]
MFDNFIYKTIDSEITDALLKIKGSKFYGLIFNVNNEQEVKNYIKLSVTLYPNATHYCYAFRIGISGELYRVNDDGEPSGTAGLPIYNQLLSSGLTNVLLIVVRYFGGTKLGVGGLIKAYKESAQYTIESAKIITKELSEKYELVFDYTYQSSIMTLLKKLTIEILSSLFSDKCNLTIELPMKKKDLFFEKFNSYFAQNFVTIKKI